MGPIKHARTGGQRTMMVSLFMIFGSWVPIIGYVIYENLSGATGGNPIGLGLLAAFGTGIGFVVAIMGALAGARARR